MLGSLGSLGALAGPGHEPSRDPFAESSGLGIRSLSSLGALAGPPASRPDPFAESAGFAGFAGRAGRAGREPSRDPFAESAGLAGRLGPLGLLGVQAESAGFAGRAGPVRAVQGFSSVRWVCRARWSGLRPGGPLGSLGLAGRCGRKPSKNPLDLEP